MDRRRFLVLGSGFGLALASGLGCRDTQVGRVMTDDKKDLSGSHAAGAETYKPLIDGALGKLLARQTSVVQTSAGPAPGVKRICFVGVENASSEELGDFKDQIVEIIDTKLTNCGGFAPISRRFVDAGLRETRLRADELFLPANQTKFIAVMQTQGQPFDYLLFAKLTSGTTRDNGSSQKDYMLTLDLVDIKTGTADKESASIRKGYSKGFGLKK